MRTLKGLNNNHLKTTNRGTVLRLIAGGRVSRTDIAQNMELSKMAISKIVGELLDEGYLTEKTIESDGAVGRNPLMLDISESAPQAVGIYISRNEVSALLCDLKLNTFFERRIPLKDETPEKLREKIFELCDAVVDHHEKNHPNNDLLGIGVSSIGPIDPSGGIILNPTNFYGICNFPVMRELEERYSLPVFCDNDMNASALAENIYGIGKEYGCFIYIGITNGIGSGAILNGRLFSNESLSIGEIGHTCINFDGPLCSCGNRGCLELYSDMTVILKRLSEASGQAAVTPEMIAGLSSRPECDAVLRDVAAKLSVALINTVNMLDPQCIVIGHEGAHLPEKYLAALDETINRGILASQYKTVRILRSTFFDRAPLLGSACLIFEKLFSGDFF